MTASADDGARAASFRALFDDESSFRAWYDAALPRVFGYLLDRCGHPTLAEELTQETFVDAVRHRASFDGRADPMTWVVGIARHKLVDHFRRRARDERRHLRLVSGHAQEPDQLERAELREDALRALRTLPAMQRAAVVLRYLDDLPTSDVSAILGRSEHAVESLLARGRRRLHEALAQDRAGGAVGTSEQEASDA